MTSRPSSTVRTLAAAALALLAVVAAAPADAADVRVPFTEPGAGGVRLTGGMDRFDAAIPMPVRWGSVGGSVRLQWRGSQELVAGSQLRVSVGGEIVGVRDVGPGPGAATFRIPRRTVRASQRAMPLLVESRLRVRGDQCPGPDRLGAYLQLGGPSAVVLQSRWVRDSLPVDALPEALVTGTGREPSPLLVRFARTPTPTAIRAASVAAGEVSGASARGVQLRIATPAEPLEQRAHEALITIDESGDAALIAEARHPRAPAVRLTGTGDGLIRAAGALRPAVAHGNMTSLLTNPPAITVKRRQVPRRIKLASARYEGYGDGAASTTFHLPVYREALRVARLRMAVTYDAPNGGRATVAINDRTVQSETLHKDGPSRFTVEEELAESGPALNRGDLQPGDNTVSVRTTLSEPADRCTFPEHLGSLTTSDFGSVTLLTRERRPVSTLTTFPYPMNRQPLWKGSTVVLPEQPTVGELRTIIGVLAEARRVTGEPALPAVQLGGALPAGPSLTLARPGAIPEDLSHGLQGPAELGVLASSAGEDGAIRFLAIGPRALLPAVNDYWFGKVYGRVAQTVAGGETAVRLDDVQRVTGVQRGPVPWRWPLIILAAAGLGLFAMLLGAAARRIRRVE